MDAHVHIQPDSDSPNLGTSEFTGAKPPLSPKHVWAIRTRLQLLKCHRDLALFNLAIDSKLRGCDLVGLRIADVAPHGYGDLAPTVIKIWSNLRATLRDPRCSSPSKPNQEVSLWIGTASKEIGSRSKAR